MCRSASLGLGRMCTCEEQSGCKVFGFEWEEVHKLQAQCVANVTDLKPVMTLTSTKSDKLQHVSKEQQVWT